MMHAMGICALPACTDMHLECVFQHLDDLAFFCFFTNLIEKTK
jgi:hypothetical protein